MTDNPALSKVTDSDAAPPEDADKAPWSLVLTGWAIAIGLTVVQLALMLPLDALADARFEAMVARERAVLWWREDTPGYAPLIVVALGLFLVIPWAHGSARWSRGKPWPPRRRKAVLIGTVVAMAAATGLSALFGGRAGGLAFAEGAAWFENGRVVERRPWSAARSILADCDMVRSGRYGIGKLTPSFTYEVSFPGGRTALLSYGGAPWAGWMETMAPIDRRLRASGGRRRGALNETCLSQMAGPGVPPDALRALLGP